MPTIRTTMQPDVDVDVNEAELLDLRRQGLLIAAPSPSTPAAAPVKTTTPAKAKES